MPVTFDLAVLQPGDIILSTQSSLTSRLIRRVTTSRFSHAMLYIDRTIVHAVAEGVWTLNPERVNFEPHEVEVYRLPNLTPKQRTAICQAARAKVGSRYTTWEATLSVVLRLARVKALGQSQYCSRLVAQAYATQGFHLHPNPDHCFPSDLVKCEGWMPVPDAIRPWTERDQFIYDSRPDTLATEGKYVFAFLRPLDWLSVLTFHGRVRDVAHAWDIVSKSRFIDFFSAIFLTRSGWLDAAGLHMKANSHQYDFELFHSGLEEMPSVARTQFLDTEHRMAFEMKGYILQNLQYYARCRPAKTIDLIKDYEYARLKVLIERLDVLSRIMVSSVIPPPGHSGHKAIIDLLAEMQTIYTTRPF